MKEDIQIVAIPEGGMWVIECSDCGPVCVAVDGHEVLAGRSHFAACHMGLVTR